jgi:UDP-N-acetylmuramyl pentapeptide synthase
MAEAAVTAGMARDAVLYFASSAEAAPAVNATLRSGDLVLVKGSRGTRCDVVADRIVQERG